MGVSGYDDEFLGMRVAAPETATGRAVVELTYTHFTVVMDPARKLAAFTAVNIDGAKLLDLGRGDDWHLDDRMPISQQTGPEVYSKNDLDRGHLVRRRDPVWGPAATAQKANVDTFAYTNAAPQASAFNQGEELWVGLEDYVLEAARAADARISVFTGPVFASTDARYRGTLIPKRFWKIAAWIDDDPGAVADVPQLRATGYVLDQTALVARFDDEHESLAPRAGVELGRFRTFQVPIADIAALTALGLDQLVAADRYATEGVRDGGWRELTSREDITL